ncbi:MULTISPECIES: PaaI family thioesterase [unclassified Dietzia]|uniref:PaaI family thioesterase n=1 Tax=unclassified Dietzia TaxID=2617939 RepID=UPI000D203FBD|nr:MULTISPECIES: PaaI family thioesterase [unclassified Dietzia]AVZ38340.1 PaaI family thioesterase [Dietzia sp. JS16-p6b]QGW23355.1 thioesterase [Dietzia sp. DQ12-45-1b]
MDDDEARDAPFDRVDTAAHSRHYSWPPLPGAADRSPHAGLEVLQRIVDGEHHLSPGSHTLGLALSSVAERVVTLTATPGEWALNNGGTVHGGIVSGWVDSALGYATATAVDEGVGYSTLDLTVRYIRALRLEKTPATIHAEVEHVGRSTCVVQAKVLNTDGRTCASASGVMMLFRP